MLHEGLDEFAADELCTTHQVDGAALLLLTEDDLKRPPVELPQLGVIKNLMVKVKKLRQENLQSAIMLGYSYRDIQINDGYCVPGISPRYGSAGGIQPNGMVMGSVERQMSSHLEPEYLKLLLSYMYMFLVFLLTAFVMVIVDDRVPDMKKYPPLPDLVLDNLPVIPGAFELCELTALTLLCIWIAILVFHKHRLVPDYRIL